MAASAQPQIDRVKFKDAVHFIVASCAPDELGRVKLHKILYFADMLHFLDAGKPFTGCEYLKQEFGPTARHLAWALSELEAAGRIRVQERQFHGFRKQDFHSLSQPDRSRLTNSEVDLLGKVIDFVCARTAREISELSHNAAWQLYRVGEVIPYYSAFFIVPTETTDEDVAWGEQTARQLGLAS
jgi:hypothetical protein